MASSDDKAHELAGGVTIAKYARWVSELLRRPASEGRPVAELCARDGVLERTFYEAEHAFRQRMVDEAKRGKRELLLAFAEAFVDAEAGTSAPEADPSEITQPVRFSGPSSLPAATSGGSSASGDRRDSPEPGFSGGRTVIREAPPASAALPWDQANGPASGRVRLGGSAPAARPELPPLTLEQYAALAVELSLTPDRATEVLGRYHVAENAKPRLDAAFQEKFRADTALRARFELLSRVFRKWISGPRVRAAS